MTISRMLRLPLRALLPALMVSLSPSIPALGAEGKLGPVDRHGAVPCAWNVYVAADPVGEMCFPGQVWNPCL